jgi:hypothetical protein
LTPWATLRLENLRRMMVNLSPIEYGKEAAKAREEMIAMTRADGSRVPVPEASRKKYKHKHKHDYAETVRTKMHSMVTVGESRIPNAGAGLFAAMDLKQHYAVEGQHYGHRIQYIGKVMNERQANESERAESTTHSSLGRYFARVGGKKKRGSFQVDAHPRWFPRPVTGINGYTVMVGWDGLAMAGLANHSEDPAVINAKLVTFEKDNIPYIAMERDVAAGEEIFINYGDDYKMPEKTLHDLTFNAPTFTIYKVPAFVPDAPDTVLRLWATRMYDNAYEVLTEFNTMLLEHFAGNDPEHLKSLAAASSEDSGLKRFAENTWVAMDTNVSLLRMLSDLSIEYDVTHIGTDSKKKAIARTIRESHDRGKSILLVVHSASHFATVEVSRTGDKITCYDSLGEPETPMETVTNIVEAYNENNDAERTLWYEKVNDQGNGRDCGVYAVANAMLITMGLRISGNLSFGSRDWEQRKRLVRGFRAFLLEAHNVLAEHINTVKVDKKDKQAKRSAPETRKPSSKPKRAAVSISSSSSGSATQKSASATSKPRRAAVVISSSGSETELDHSDSGPRAAAAATAVEYPWN